MKLLVIIGDVILWNILLMQIPVENDGAQGDGMLQTHLVLSLLYICCAQKGGVVFHRPKVRKHQIVGGVLQTMTLFAASSAVLLWWGGFRMPHWGWYTGFLVGTTLLISCYRLGLRKMVRAYRLSEKNVRHVVLVGSNDNIVELCNELRHDPSLGAVIDGYFDDKPCDKFGMDIPWLGQPKDVIGFLKAHTNVHECYCCLPSARKDEIMPIIFHCENHLVHFYSVPNVRNYLRNRMHFNIIGDVPYLSLHEEPLSSAGNRAVKRCFDILFSLTFLCTLFPFVLLIVTLATKATMPGPVFFRQKRNGLNGKEFYCLKFRSMRVNDDADKLQATKDDPRKTKWGNLMRKTNIDELPQFINVLMGDMSVVGPRPHMVRHTEEYSQVIDKYMVRHWVKPGITGWSQVTGFRGETQELSQMAGRIHGDIWYIEHWSLRLDLYIIYKTIANTLRGEDKAY